MKSDYGLQTTPSQPLTWLLTFPVNILMAAVYFCRIRDKAAGWVEYLSGRHGWTFTCSAHNPWILAHNLTVLSPLELPSCLTNTGKNLGLLVLRVKANTKDCLALLGCRLRKTDNFTTNTVFCPAQPPPPPPLWVLDNKNIIPSTGLWSQAPGVDIFSIVKVIG